MKILLSIDPNHDAVHLLRVASAWAARLGAEIHVRTAVEIPATTDLLVGPGQLDVLQQTLDAHRAQVRDQVLRLATDELPEAMRGSVEVLDGPPQRVIPDAAGGFDLVITGTSGRRGLTRIFMGSVAEAIARFSPCPVLIVPHAAEAPPLDAPLRVIAPMAAEAPSTAALDWVRDHLPGADLHPVYVMLQLVALDGSDLLRPDDRTGEATEAWALARLREAIGADGPAPEVLRSHDAGSVGEAVVAQAQATGAHLIAMPSAGRSGLARVALGSVAERTARTSDRAVLILHPKG